MDAVAATSSSTAANMSAAAQKAKKSALGAEDFLKLLTVQLENQDPMDPMKDTEFISQMANFTSLQTMSELKDNFSDFSAEQQRMAAQTYLGKQVTVESGGSEATGIVSAVSSTDDGGLTLTVGGTDYSIGDVRRVALASSATTTPQE